jgi:hypothetical protein
VVISLDFGHSGAAIGFASTVEVPGFGGATRDWTAGFAAGAFATDLTATGAFAAGFTATRATGLAGAGRDLAAGPFPELPLVLAVALLTGAVREGVFDAVREAPEGVTLAIADAV